MKKMMIDDAYDDAGYLPRRAEPADAAERWVIDQQLSAVVSPRLCASSDFRE